MITIGGAPRLDRAEFGNRDLEVGQYFEQKRLERLIRPIEFVDEEDRRAALVRFERLDQRPLQKIAARVNVGFYLVARQVAGGLGEADCHHLRGIIPLVDGARDIETIVALQADEAPPERARQNLGDFRLADASLAFEKQWTSEAEREEEHGG